MITAYQAYVAFQQAISSLSGSMVEGLQPKKAEHFINLGIDDLAIDAYAGSQEIQPEKIRLILENLKSASQTLDKSDFIVGSALNGALRSPDTDKQSLNDGDKFCAIGQLPDEALKIIARVLDMKTTDKDTRYDVECMPITLDYYWANIRNWEKTPNIHHTWALEQLAITPSNKTTPSVESVRGIDGYVIGSPDVQLGDVLTNIVLIASDALVGTVVTVAGDYPVGHIYKVGDQISSYTILAGDARIGTSGIPKTIVGNSVQLVLPAGFNVVNYQVHYLKKPKHIVIDKLFQYNVDSDLPEILLSDIIARAKKFFQLAQIGPEGFQATDAATKD